MPKSVGYGMMHGQEMDGRIQSMNKHARVISLVIMAGFLCTSAVSAQEAGGSDAARTRDDAISKIVAWRTQSGESSLTKKAQLDDSQPWLTAQGLLMATYGIGQDDALVQKGLDLLTAQAKNAPDDPVAEYYRGVVLAWTGQGDKAKAAWQSAKKRAEAQVKKDSKDARAQFYLGASLVQLKDPVSARKALKKAERAGWDKPMVDFQNGLSYLLQENWKAAKESFDDVHELDPRYAHLYFYRAIAWEKLGQKDQLIIDLDQFVKLAPNSPEAKTARAILGSR
jgi:tetratricopeptide (TPR) repeat protein